jgi:hypothetical protein
MYGKMTTSRIGIIGRRRVSDFSLEVSMGICCQVTWFPRSVPFEPTTKNVSGERGLTGLL